MKLLIHPPLQTTLFLLILLMTTIVPVAYSYDKPSPKPAVKSSRAPEYVSIQMEKSEQPLVAGEKGILKLKASLVAGQDLHWDSSVKFPVTLWIATPDGSGITFIDNTHPERPSNHILVRFPHPTVEEDGALIAQVEYTVNSRTKAGNHSFWMDIFAELKEGGGGQQIHDTGALGLPFMVDTHLRTKLLMLAVVAAAVFLFIVEWVRVDVVAIVMMVLLPELGLLNSSDTFRGLSSNAVVAIIGVMIISCGLNRAGLVHRIIQPILGFVSKSPNRLVVVFSGLIAGISGVMQNTGAAVLFLPAIRTITFQRLKIPLSRVLMPIGMAAILGGTLTMIGTSPLILLNDILPPGMEKFGFLELTPIGAALALAGIAYLSTFGMRMLTGIAERQSEIQRDNGEEQPIGLEATFPMIHGPFEIKVPEDYQAQNNHQELLDIRQHFLVNIVAMAKADNSHDYSPPLNTNLQPGSTLCAYGRDEDIEKFIHEYGLTKHEQPQVFKGTMFNPSLAGLVEGVVLRRSSLVGKSIREIGFRQMFGVNPLAVDREGHTYFQDLSDLPLKSGDTLLLQGTWKNFHALQELHQNLIIITPFEQEFHKPEKAKWAGGCFLVALSLMILSSFYFQKLPYNPIPLSVCLMVGAVGMVLCKVITISEAYQSVDWRTVFLLGGLIPLGMAVDQTGTANWIAEGIVAGLGGLMSPLLLLLVLAVLSTAFTLVISNVGAATLLVPLGISIAHHIGMDPRVCAIVVGIGVSNSFFLPTHQVNALYMGPGEYRTRDYIKIGGGLSIIYIAVLVLMTYTFYL